MASIQSDTDIRYQILPKQPFTAIDGQSNMVHMLSEPTFTTHGMDLSLSYASEMVCKIEIFPSNPFRRLDKTHFISKSQSAKACYSISCFELTLII